MMSCASHSLSPIRTAEFVSTNAKHVTVWSDGVQKLAVEVLNLLRKKEICINNFSQHELHPQTADDSAIAWIFLVDTLNFSFWTHPTSPKKWEVSHRGKLYTGYFGLCAAINRAVDNGVPLLDPKFYSQVTRETLKDLFRGDDNDCEIPLIDERVTVLHQVGQVLLDKYKGSFANCVRQSNHSAERLLQLIVSDFPCFNDVADYREKKVSLHKRAQILIGDIWACFHGEGDGRFNDIDIITMFADYRIPQVLVHYGVITYSDELMAKLRSNTLLENGSSEEVEIRACSIEAVSMVVKAVNHLMTEEDENLQINAILVDHFLWDYRRRFAKELEAIPFHLTRCIFY